MRSRFTVVILGLSSFCFFNPVLSAAEAVEKPAGSFIKPAKFSQRWQFSAGVITPLSDYAERLNPGIKTDISAAFNIFNRPALPALFSTIYLTSLQSQAALLQGTGLMTGGLWLFYISQNWQISFHAGAGPAFFIIENRNTSLAYRHISFNAELKTGLSYRTGRTAFGLEPGYFYLYDDDRPLQAFTLSAHAVYYVDLTGAES